jgi:hypothetical protein
MHETYLLGHYYSVEQYYILLDSVHLSETYLTYKKFWNVALLLSSSNSNMNPGLLGAIR